MISSIYPCLWFDDKAKAAAQFYGTVFKNSKITSDTPMVVTFDLNGKKFMGLNGGPMFTFNPSISFFVLCDSAGEVDEKWNKLMESGKALMPLDKYPWSERYGWAQDKFGLTWQIMLGTKPGEGGKITPSMLFTGKQFGRAEEAIRFYTGVFPGCSTDTLIHYPTNDENAGKVMYSEFKLNSGSFIAMDGPGAHEYTFNEAVSFVVECETQEEIDNYWNRFTEGGQESMCGWLKDKFGVSWQIVPAVLGKLMSDPERAPKVTQAFLKMKKFDIEKLLKA